jgi:CheY-like chemotaxis protein
VARRILIVEDEALVAAELEFTLEEAGFEVAGWATDSAEALALAESARPDLALVDIQLRGGDDGVALAQRLSALGLGIVFLSAQADPATVARAGAVPHRAYVRKPYRQEELFAALGPPGA